jgi:hypothetical protein
MRQHAYKHAYNSVRSVAEEVGASDDMLKGEDDGPIQEDFVRLSHRSQVVVVYRSLLF